MKLRMMARHCVWKQVVLVKGVRMGIGVAMSERRLDVSIGFGEGVRFSGLCGNESTWQNRFAQRLL